MSIPTPADTSSEPSISAQLRERCATETDTACEDCVLCVAADVLEHAAGVTAVWESVDSLFRTLLGVHASVQMDTPEDKALHARAVETFTDAWETVTKDLAASTGQRH